MSWLRSFKGLSLGKGNKHKRDRGQDSRGRKRPRPSSSSSSYYPGSYDLATPPPSSSDEERTDRFSWAEPFEEEHVNDDSGKRFSAFLGQIPLEGQ